MPARNREVVPAPPTARTNFVLGIAHEAKFQLSLLANMWDLTGVQNTTLKTVGGIS